MECDGNYNNLKWWDFKKQDWRNFFGNYLFIGLVFFSIYCCYFVDFEYVDFFFFYNQFL